MITKDDFNKKINNKKQDDKHSYLKGFLFKILIKSLIVVILFLAALIYIKQSDKNKDKFKDVVYNNSLSFAKIYNMYKKYLGDALPFKNIFKDNTKVVSNNKLTYSSIKKENNGYLLDVESMYSVSAITDGIIIKIQDDNTYKTMITIQDENSLNITYGLLSDLNVSLYDYVEQGEILGVADKELYLIFEKDDNYLSYEEYL